MRFHFCIALLLLALGILSLGCENTVNIPRENLLITGFANVEANQSISMIGEIVDLNREQAVLEHGHCWSIAPQASIADSCTRLGRASSPGRFVSSLNNLEEGTIYYVRGYLQTNEGIIYGDQIELSLPPPSFQLSAFTTGISNITGTAASVFGQVNTELAIVSHGHIWSTDANPSLANNIGLSDLGAKNTQLAFNFSTSLDSLSPNTIYFTRTYAVVQLPDSENTKVVYGNILSFSTFN